MSESEDRRAEHAATCTEESIASYIHDSSPPVIHALLNNRNITEEHILIIAGRKNVPADILDAIFRSKRWSESYAVRVALAKNPKTPLFTALSIARFLRLFDLAEISRNQTLPVIYRKKVGAIVIEKIPTLALGIKKTLAKVASGDILLSLIQDGYPEVVKICLDNPHLVEASLYKIISRKTTTGATIRSIADHKNWTCRYHIKFALIRNAHTPLVRCVLFLTSLKTADLKELYRDPTIPRTVRPYIHQELMERGIDPELLPPFEEEQVIEIGQGEMADSEMALLEYEESEPAEPAVVTSENNEEDMPANEEDRHDSS
ncbi:MAG: hypothetical protein OEW15_10405 [Nitrospirota bacterium]|nr:hypothetical protein [Nitrospirota bacterium]